MASFGLNDCHQPSGHTFDQIMQMIEVEIFPSLLQRIEVVIFVSNSNFPHFYPKSTINFRLDSNLETEEANQVFLCG